MRPAGPGTGFLLAAALVLLSPLADAAGGSVTVQTFDPTGNVVTVSVEALDLQHLRVASPQHPEGYLVMLGDDTYDVLQIGAMPIVVDAADMAAKLGGSAPVTPAANDDIHKFVGLEPTGKKETIAGIVGDVDRLRFLDGNNRMQEEDLVVARDPLLQELSFGLYRLGAVMSSAAGVATPDGTDHLARDLYSRGLGILRMGTRMKVVAVNRTVPAPGRFDLPAEPMRSLPSLQ